MAGGGARDRLSGARCLLVLCVAASAEGLAAGEPGFARGSGIRPPRAAQGVRLGARGGHGGQCGWGHMRLSGGEGGSDAGKALATKNKGNAMFRDKRFDEARDAYSEALGLMPDDLSSDKERVNCLNNRAACHVKLGDYEGCIQDCTRALGLDPRNEKARLRRGIALETIGYTAKAAADMVLLLTERADNQHAKACLERCLEESPTLRADIVAELQSVIPSSGDPSQEEARLRAAKALSERVFIGVLGLSPDMAVLQEREGPRAKPVSEFARKHEKYEQLWNEQAKEIAKEDAERRFGDASARITSQTTEGRARVEKETEERQRQYEAEQAEAKRLLEARAKEEEEKKAREDEQKRRAAEMEERRRAREEEEREERFEARRRQEEERRAKEDEEARKKEKQELELELRRRDEEAKRFAAEMKRKDDEARELARKIEEEKAERERVEEELRAAMARGEMPPKLPPNPAAPLTPAPVAKGAQRWGGGTTAPLVHPSEDAKSFTGGGDSEPAPEPGFMDQELMGLSVKDQISKKLQVPNKDPKTQLRRLADNVKDIDVRLETLTSKVEDLDHEELGKDQGPAMRLLNKLTKQCMEYSELIMMLTEGLDSVSSPEVRQERRTLIAQLQGLLVEVDQARFKIDSLGSLISRENKLVVLAKQLAGHVAGVAGAAWEKKWLFLFTAASSGVLKLSKEHGGLVETGYVMRDKCLEGAGVAQVQLKRLQDYMFPLPDRHQYKKRLNERELQEFYRREKEMQEKSMQKARRERELERQARERERERRLKATASAERNKKMKEKLEKAASPMTDAAGVGSQKLKKIWKDAEVQKEADRLREEMDAAMGKNDGPLQKFARWYKNLA